MVRAVHDIIHNTLLPLHTMSDKAPGRIIYIGSIPYDQTEEQIMDIAKSIGPVVNLEMMFDKETGRSKGYAFVEYSDVETAASAVRNLNNYSIGNRQLRCDFSRENTISSAGANSTMKGKTEDTLPPLPAGTQLQPGQKYSDAISNVVNGLDKARVEQIVIDAKKMAQRNPVLLENLLAQCPQLSYAIVEALLQTKTVDEQAIAPILLNQPVPEPAQEPTEELSSDQLALIKQVIALSDAELSALPEDQRVQILQLKENYNNGVYGSL